MARWSPYNYTYNNPLIYTDPSGMKPFTDYYDQEGNKLLSTNDGSDNVVIIDAGKEKNFKYSAARRSASIDETETNESLSSYYGKTYDVESFGAFFDANEGDIASGETGQYVDVAGNSIEVANEHASFLYENDAGVVSVGTENIRGIGSSNIQSGDLKPEKSGSVGTIHTHPSQDKGLLHRKSDGSYAPNRAEGIPSSFDKTYHAPRQGYFSVITTAKRSIFFNETKKFDVPRK